MANNNEMRCLAIRQPFAWAICSGAKTIENRSWTTDYRGDIIVVASGTPAEVKRFQKDAKPTKLNSDHLTLSAVIGIATLVDVLPLSHELEANPWAFGPYCWKLENGRLFKEPIPCKGKLKLYAPEPDLAAHISRQIPLATTPTLDANASAWIAAMLNVSADERIYAHMDNYSKLEDWNNALRMTTSGLALNPDDLDHLAGQADALFNLERHKDALRVLDRLATLVPDNPAIYHLRSLNYAALNQPDDFQREQDKVIALDPNFYDDFNLEEAEEGEK